MEFLVIAILLTVTGAHRIQMEGPQNTLSVVGSNVTLKCSPPSGNCTGVDWMKSTSSNGPQTVFADREGILNAFKDRFSVDNSSGCDLVINDVKLTDAARFICTIFISGNTVAKSAYLIILSTQPKCATNASLDDTVDGEGVRMTCEVTYNGTGRATMFWKGLDIAPNAVENGKTIRRSNSIAASAPEVPSATCVTSFDVSDAKFESLASNVPTASCETTSIRVLYSVRNVTLEPSRSHNSPGSIITCMAKGDPSPTFKWQELEDCGIWKDVHDRTNSRFTIDNDASRWYRCVAMNVVRGNSYNATSEEFQVTCTDSVRDVTLEPSHFYYPPGTNITCMAKRHPTPSFKWQELEDNGIWKDIPDRNSSSFSINNDASRRYRCVAMNVVGGKSYNATSEEFQVNNTGVSSSEVHVGGGIGIGFGIGLLTAILLAFIASATLVRLGYVEFHLRPVNKPPGVDSQPMKQKKSHSSRQQSSIPSGKVASSDGQQESAYASLGNDRDASEYESLEKRPQVKPKKKSRP